MQQPEVDLLIKGGLVVTVDAHDAVLEGADIAVRGNRIVEMGADLSCAAKRVIDAKRKAVLPGFVDVHMHECLMRGFCEDMPLMEWLEKICFPKDRAQQASHSYAGALMNQLEMIRAGITTFVDIWRYAGEGARVAEQSGLRGIFSPQIIEWPAGAGETLESNRRFVEEWRDRVPGRIYTWFGPHAPYSCSAELYREVVRLAEHYGVGIHTHVAETKGQVEYSQSRYGKSPVEWLDSLGVLGPKTLAAHCVWLTEKDIEILKARDVPVAHCPVTGAKMPLGVAPVLELLKQGIRVGLGTDSILSSNRLDMFAEMKTATLLQRLKQDDAAALPSRKALRMATIDAAACVGLGEEIGSLEVGKKADMVLIDLGQPHFWPLAVGETGNVYSHLVYTASAGDVVTTIVDGRVLMENRQVLTLDAEMAAGVASAEAADLARRAWGLELRPMQW